MRSLTTLSFLIALATAQTCYYPDGKTVSTDVPCSTSGACCPQDSFCMANGFCFGGGLVSRSSCTDASWTTKSCAAYCQNESPSSSIALTPLSETMFSCGFNSTSDPFSMAAGGSSIVLRSSQVAQLVNSALSPQSNQTNSTCSSTGAIYTPGQMAGLGFGLGLPLFFALLVTLFMLRREKQKYATPKLMYKLPDEIQQQEFTFRPPPSISKHPAYAASSVPTSDSGSGKESRRASLKSSSTGKPAHMQSFEEKYGKFRHELESDPPTKPIQRHELGDTGKK